MRKLLMLPLLLMVGLAKAETTSVTTKPAATPEVEQLRTQVKALTQERDLLRAQLAALGKTPQAPTTPTTMDDKPITGVEGLIAAFPTNQLPGPDDGTASLRHSLLAKFIQTHSLGRTILLHGRFVEATALSQNSFDVKLVNGRNAQRQFVAQISLPEAEATTVVNFKKGSSVQAIGQISGVNVTRTPDGSFLVELTIVHASVNPEGMDVGK